MISKIYYSIVAVLILCTLVACELFNEGFGDKVDLKGPDLSITSDGNSYVSGILSLTGTATDDTKVSSVIIEYHSNVDDSVKRVNASLSGNIWKLDIDTTDKSQFKDGEVEFIAKVTDEAGKETTQKILKVIDNTMPTVLVTSPSQYDTKIASEEEPIIKYNQTLIIKGETSDAKIVGVETFLKTLDGTTTYKGTVTGFTSWVSTFDTVALGIPDGQYNFIVKATDSAGNVNDYYFHFANTYDPVGKKTYTVDEIAINQDNAFIKNIRKTGDTPEDSIMFSISEASDAPTHKLISKDTWSDVDQNIFLPNTPISLSFKVLDDDSIAKVTVNVKNRTTNTVLKEAEYNPIGLIQEKDISISLEQDDWGEDWTKGLWNSTGALGSYSVTVDIEDNNSPAVTNTFSFDYSINQGPPTINNLVFSGINAKGYVETLEDFSITGDAEDSDGIKVVSVEFTKADNTKLPLITKSFSSNNISFSFKESELSALSSIMNVEKERYTAKVIVTDGSDTEAYSEKVLQVDTKLPTGVIYITGESSSSDEPTINGKIKLRLSGADNSNIIEAGELFYSTDNRVSWTSLKVGDNGYSWEYDLDSKLLDSSYISTTDAYIRLDVKDVAGNIGSIDRKITIDQSKDVPIFSLTNVDKAFTTPATAKNNKILNENFISGTLVDDDNIDVDSVMIRVSTDGAVGTWEKISNLIAESTKEYIWTHNISSNNNGDYYIELKAKDKSGVTYPAPGTASVKECYFTFDKDFPLVSVSNIEENDFIPNIFTVKIEAFDNSGIKSASVIVDGKPPVPAVYDSVDGKWVCDNLTASTEGNVTVSVTAKDIYDKETVSDEITLIYDQTSPEKFTIDPLPKVGIINNVLSGIYPFSGEVSDSVSNIDRVEYELDGKTAVYAVGKGFWKAELDTTTLLAGPHTIVFRAWDNAGNKTPDKTLNITVDQIKPVVTEKNPSSRIVSGSYTLEGTATDDYEIETLTVNATAVTVDGSGNWTLPGAANEGKNSYEIIATDKAGRENKITREVILDTKGPEVDIATIDFLTGNSFDITGSVKDASAVTDVSGVDKVYFQIQNKETAAVGKDANGITDPSKWTEATGTSSWSAEIDPVSYGEGEKVLYVISKDKVGNFGSIKEEDFFVDENPPTIEVTKAPVAYTKGPFSIEGTVNDSQGFGENPVYIKIGDATPIQVAIDAGKNWAYSSTLPGTDSKVFTIKVWVKDIAKRPSAEVIKGVTLDKTAPTILDPELSPYIGTNTVNETVKLSIDASDNNVFDGIRYWIVSSSTDISGYEWETPDYKEIKKAPFKADVDTTGYGDGLYKIHVMAKDLAGNTATKTKNINIDQNSDNPVITYGLDKTANSATAVQAKESGSVNRISGSYRLSGTVSDDDAIDNDLITIWIADKDGVVLSGSDNITISGKPSSSGKNLDWSHDISGLEEGIYQFKLTVKDKKADNIKTVTTTSPIFFSVDRGAPNLSITSPKNNDFLKDTVVIEGTVIDGNGVKALYVDTNFDKLLNESEKITVESDGSWSTTISAQSNGSYELRIKAVDNYGQEIIDIVNYTCDSKKPVIEFTSHSADQIINGKVLLTGSVTDDTNIKTLKIDLGDGNGLKDDFDNTNKNSWKKIFDTTGVTGETPRVITVEAIDQSGNIHSETLNLIIKQESDKPVIDLTTSLGDDLKKTYVDDTQWYLVPTTFNLKGTVTDDDGLKTLTVTGAPSTPVTPVSGYRSSFTHNYVTEGRYTLNYVADDINHGTVNANSTYGTSTESIKLAVDNGAPVISNIVLPGGKTTFSNNFNLTADIVEGNGIKDITIKLGDITVKDGLTTATINQTVDVSGITGDADLVITATDNFNQTSSVTIPVLIDKAAPSVNISYPGTGSLTNSGEITLKGSADDDTTLDKVTVQILKSDRTAFVGDDLNDKVNNGYLVDPIAVDGTYNWNKVFTDTEIKNIQKEYVLETISKNIGGIEKVIDVYKIPFVVKATDIAGNSKTTLDEGVLTIYPDGDLPFVKITSPTEFSLNGGIVNFTGSAYDDEGLTGLKVYMQVDVNGDKSFDHSYTYDNNGTPKTVYESTPLEATVQGSWNIKINKDSEYYATNTLESGEIYVKVWAEDKTGDAGPAEFMYITLDSSGPNVGEITAEQAGESLIVDGRMRSVKGLFTVKSTVTDNLGISDIQYSTNGGESYSVITKDDIQYSNDLRPIDEEKRTYNPKGTPLNTLPAKIDKDNKTLFYTGLYGNSVKISKDIDSSSMTFEKGSLAGEMKFSILAFDTTQYQQSRTLRINVDNEAPITSFTSNTYSEILNSGSDKKLVFGGTATDSNTIDKIEFWLTKGGSTITLPNGNTIFTLDDRYAKGTDLDGDGFKESWTREGNNLKWYAEIGSVDPGFATDFEVNYKIYDEAGNTSQGVTAPIIIGTDMNGDGTLQEGEKLNYQDNFKVTDKVYIGVKYSDSTGKKLTITGPGAPTGDILPSGGSLGTTITHGGSVGVKLEYVLNIYDNSDSQNPVKMLTKTLKLEVLDDSEPPEVTFDGVIKESEGEIGGHIDGDNISGVISFSGKATDNTWLKEIKCDVDSDGTDEVIATWGDYGLVGVVTEPGVEPAINCIITSQTIDWNSGHTVNWTVDVATPMPKSGYNLKVSAKDAGDNPGEKISKDYSVVPYIKGIESALSSLQPMVPTSLSRSSMGKYPVWIRDTDQGDINYLTISGYNFDKTATVVVEHEDKSTTSLKVNDAKSTPWNLVVELDEKIKSGKLELKMNSQKTKNNGNFYEPNNYNNNLLTDIREIEVWKLTDIAETKGAYEPVMAVSKDGSTVNFAYAKNFDFYMMRNGVAKHYEKATAMYNNLAISMDDNTVYGWANNGSVEGLQVGAATFFHGAAESFSTSSVGFYESNNWSPRFESIVNDSKTNIERTQSPSMVTIGDRSKSGDETQVYIAYYDALTKEIAFRYRKLNDVNYGGMSGTWGTIGVLQKGSHAGREVVKSGLGEGVKLSLTVTDDGTAVIAWKDPASDFINISYKTKAGSWTTATEKIDNGQGENFVIKSSGNNVYLAYQSKANYITTLNFAFMNNKGADIKTCIIDKGSIPGDGIDMTVIGTKPYISYRASGFGLSVGSVRVASPEFTVLSTTVKPSNAGFTGNLYSGKWNISAVPINAELSSGEYRISIGEYSNNKPVIGYGTTKGLQYAVKQ